LPVCLLVSSGGTELTEVFAVGSLLAAVAVGFWSVINDIPPRLCWPTGAASAVAFVLWIWHAALLGSSGNFCFLFLIELVA